MSNLCWLQKKKRYHSEEFANSIKDRVNREKGYVHIKAVYFCESCESWHITSLNQKIQKEIDTLRDRKPTVKQEYIFKQVDERLKYLKAKFKIK